MRALHAWLLLGSRLPPDSSLSRTAQPDMANVIAIGLAPVTGPLRPINRFWKSAGESFQSTTTDHRACACGTTFSIAGRMAFFFQFFKFLPFLMEKRGTGPVLLHFPECAKLIMCALYRRDICATQQCGG